jgi:hypothetical protein
MPTEPVDPILYTEQINAQRDIYLQEIKEFNIADEELFSTYATILIDISNNINNIVTEIQTSATGLAEYDNYLNLTKIKDENDALTNSFLQAENVKNGSKTMIHDTKSEYNYQYYKNVQLFIGIIAIIGLSTKIFSGK